MQFSENWLRTMVNPEMTTEELAHLMTMSGLEVEEVMPVFTQPDPYPHPMLVELFTDAAEDVRLLKDYYHQLKADRANS